MSKNYEHIKKYRNNVKNELVKLFGSKCSVCDYDKSIHALEFHHINPEEKEFSVCSYSYLNKAKLLDEAKKCILVCSNCHKEIHYDECDVKLEYINLNQNEIEDFLKVPKKEYDECPICGNKKEKSHKTCSLKCAGIKKSKISWDDIDLKKLLLEGNGWNDIGEMLDISGNAVKKRAKKLNLLQYYTDPRKSKCARF
jgi:hypothetical protein